VFKAVEDRAPLEKIVGRITDYYESFQTRPWQADFSTAFADQMIKRIVAFEIEITRLQGKWKLNQNHSESRRRRVAERLNTLGGDNDRQIAGLMNEDLPS
jgi:transcriptional regulator